MDSLSEWLSKIILLPFCLHRRFIFDNRLSSEVQRSLFDFLNSAWDLEFFHNCSLKGGKRAILERINNLDFAWHKIESFTLWLQAKHETVIKLQNQLSI